MQHDMARVAQDKLTSLTLRHEGLTKSPPPTFRHVRGSRQVEAGHVGGLVSTIGAPRGDWL